MRSQDCMTIFVKFKNAFENGFVFFHILFQWQVAYKYRKNLFERYYWMVSDNKPGYRTNYIITSSGMRFSSYGIWKDLEYFIVMSTSTKCMENILGVCKLIRMHLNRIRYNVVTYVFEEKNVMLFFRFFLVISGTRNF